ncbi:hypothetical protein [Flavobacterium filum]|uniref:hypothetical protein n=1 Tax=Flavobacterium filum TaxID=370974 RepID=UPI000405BD74|nr:hypothetical protein [Flavobacterium filum]
MKKRLIVISSFLFISCFTEPKKAEEKEDKIENVIVEKEVEEIEYAQPLQIESKISGEDFAKSILIKTFDSNSEIYNHYDGCGCYFASTKEDFYAGDKNVFFGTFLGEKDSNIELLINDKTERLFFDGKDEVDSEVYYKYTNSQHEALIKLKKENIESEEGLYLSGGIIVDKIYVSGLFGRCGC